MSVTEVLLLPAGLETAEQGSNIKPTDITLPLKFPRGGVGCDENVGAEVYSTALRFQTSFSFLVWKTTATWKFHSDSSQE